MFELWVPTTITAAFFQNLRSALQKHIKGKLSTAGAAYARFFYAWPFALVYAGALAHWGDFEIPDPNTLFLTYVVLGGVAQILFTFFLLWMFSYRNFAVGTTFSKLEIVPIAVFGLLILGDGLTTAATVAIVVSVVGVLFLSIGQSRMTTKSLFVGLMEKPTIIGLTCAALLGASVVFCRGAVVSLENTHFIMGAAYALVFTLVFQTILMGVYLVWREPGEFSRVLANWRWAGAVGIAGVLGSICWFTAFAIQNAAHVRALGQIELVFTFIASAVFFREKIDWRELAGIFLVIGAILIILIYG